MSWIHLARSEQRAEFDEAADHGLPPHDWDGPEWETDWEGDNGRPVTYAVYTCQRCHERVGSKDRRDSFAGADERECGRECAG